MSNPAKFKFEEVLTFEDRDAASRQLRLRLDHPELLPLPHAQAARMLQSQMTENRTGRCVFPDMPKSVLIPVVKFMYNGSLDGGIEDDPVSVLLAADRLQVTGLAKHCEEILIGQLTSENVVDLLLLAGKVPALPLKDDRLRFVRNNLAALKGSGAIKMLMEKAGAELVDEIMASVSNV
ncbi:hypothetical protein RvY_16581 [Ramazzottius varieornatus]|uniref:BTB domain-containing protein n=1 Tax=Ramazzottius varieornatus TaxID=947166 RepID=A0A1D1VZ10_RAMVA|nr:hypothetical protein RvY_16581 [Ramazzottius varieornatus]